MNETPNHTEPQTNWLCAAFCLYAAISLLGVAFVLYAGGQLGLAAVTTLAVIAIGFVGREEVR